MLVDFHHKPHGYHTRGTTDFIFLFFFSRHAFGPLILLLLVERSELQSECILHCIRYDIAIEKRLTVPATSRAFVEFLTLASKM